MAKILRKTQKQFGSTAVAAANGIAQFGSLAAGAAAFTLDPAVIQALSNYAQGWIGAVIGGNSPALEDENAIDYLHSYQLCYLMQTGVPEWDSGTTYFIGSVVNDGLGGLYSSITDTNLNHAVTDATNWKRVNGSTVVTANPTSPYTVLSADFGKVFDITTAAATFTFTLPTGITAGFEFFIKDVGGNAGTNKISVAPAATETIEGLNVAYACEANYGFWCFIFDGTNWWLN